MSKLAESLRALKVFNNHGLIGRFGGQRDVWVDYIVTDSRSVRCNHSSISSPNFQTAPGAPWYCSGSKQFTGNRDESLPKALAWASETYGITAWAVSPFGGRVPAHVLKRAKEAAKLSTIEPDSAAKPGDSAG